MAEETGREILFQMRSAGKSYGSSEVLKNVDLEIYKGEVIGLIGENGAGKSTLLKIICGAEDLTTGEMFMNGVPYKVRSLPEANRQCVGMVFQEQSLVLNITVAQNIYLGREAPYSFAKIINWRKMNRDAVKVLERLGMENTINVSTKVLELNFVSRQMVEIAKTLDVILTALEKSGSGGALLLLDEPTTVLSSAEIEVLFREVKKIKERGVSVIFVSHRLDEVLAISDRIYIFKDGEKTGEVETEKADTAMLYEKMVGRSTTGRYYHTEEQCAAQSGVLLEAESLSKFGYFKDVSFKLYKGEVLGFCGVEGSGKEELCAVLCGDDEWTSGSLKVRGKPVKAFKNPAEALDTGVLSIPRDRRLEGLIGNMSVSFNMIISSFKKLARFSFISPGETTAISNYWVKKMGVKCTGIDERIDRLSGGNAQKVIFARVSGSGADILILNHPTRGVDIGAKEDLYRAVREMTAAGKAVILLGDTLDECIGLSSRIFVMKDGLVQKEFDCPADAKPEQVDIVKYMI